MDYQTWGAVQFLAIRFPDARMKRGMAARGTMISLATRVVADHRRKIADAVTGDMVASRDGEETGALDTLAKGG